jgi:hypothetical protein
VRSRSQRRMVRFDRCIGLGAIALTAVGIAAGCGGGGGTSSNDSFASISSSISKPTGTVSATTVSKVGTEFSKVSATEGLPSLGGMREDDQVGAASGSASYTCAAGGSISANANGDKSSGRLDEKIDHCCQTANCCADGSATIYYSQSSQSASDTSGYTLCMNMDVSGSCDSKTYAANYSGCIGQKGWVYNVEVDGANYAVSGTYNSGSGSLTITGANGSWTCTYSSGAGDCTSSAGESFHFTASSSS